ncbi:hypothetical protein [Thiomicrospira microaerophila]|uniref:hypothetical protein n=1 Tax=Thiomicrospira microaerophila TaxID=406020 RepID=UPI0005C83CCE|nr:hypothetical protein [Thiomicrospira microaerophila]
MAIATRLTEGRLTFQFSGDADSATKYDDWIFYRNQFNSAFGGTKAVDVSKVQLKLKQWLKALDAHPTVVDKTSLKATMPWSVV